MKTLRAYIVYDGNGMTVPNVVGHCYTLENDVRRYTDHYDCGNPVAAERLVSILNGVFK